MFFIIAIVVIVVLVVRSKKKSAEATSSTPSASSSTVSDKPPANVPANSTPAVKTLSAEDSAFRTKDIFEWPDLPSKIMCSEILALSDIWQALWENMVSKDIPVVFNHGRIAYGNSFNKHYEDCIIISHKKPPESYFDFAITCRVSEGNSFVRIYRSGGSYYNYKLKEYQNSKTETDGVIMALNLVGYALNKPDVQAWEDGYTIENMYYDSVKCSIREVFNI